MLPAGLDLKNWSVLRDAGPANDTRQIQRVFEVFLSEARWRMAESWLSGESKVEDTGLNPFSHHRQMLDWMNRASPVSQNPLQQVTLPERVEPLALEEVLPDDLAKLISPSDGLSDPVEEKSPSIADLVKQSADKHGIPEQWFKKLIRIESNFDPKAKSPKGAMGLGQLMPSTARDLGLRVGEDSKEGSVWHPESNLDASARYLKWLHGQFAERGIEDSEAWSLSAAAYNAGIGNITRVMEQLGESESVSWPKVAARLSSVTGSHAKETLSYVARLRA